MLRVKSRFHGLCPYVLALVCLAFVCFLTACGEEDVFISESGRAPRSGESQQELPDPWPAVQKTLDILSRDDPAALMDMVYPMALDRYGRSQIVDRHIKIHADLGIRSIQFTNLAPLERSEEGRQVFYSGDVRYESSYGEIKARTKLVFIWHPAANAWQLDWTPSVILPGINENGEVRVETIKARRGSILDRAGWPLAINAPSVRISLIPQYFDRSRTAETEEMLGLPAGTIEQKLSQPWVRDDVLVPIQTLSSLKNLDYETIKELGLQWDRQETRLYPFAEATASLVGYVGIPTAEELQLDENKNLDTDDLIGKTGIEAIYDRKLRGKDGFRIFISGAYEKTLVEEPVEDGENIQLSIDAIAQRNLYQELKDDNMSVTAVDPESGDILVLLSTPSFDPSLFVSGISNADYELLLNDERNPLAAKYSAAYTPGSTQKIITAALALREADFDPQELVTIYGKTWRLDDSWGNYAVTRAQALDQDFNLVDALRYSDNIYFARLATEKLGVERFNQGLMELGVGEEVCPDFPFAPAQISNHGPLQEGETILLADSAYGQGELLYPQASLCQIYSMVLNGGYLRPLRLVLPEEDTSPAAAHTEPFIDPSKTAVLKEAMAQVAELRYPKQLESEKLRLAGKSGTAELGLDPAGEMRINSWFIGYEQDHPSICLALTHFDSQKHAERFYAIRRFRDLFETLYNQKTYQPPARQKEIRELSDIPTWTPVSHPEAPEPEVLSEADEEADTEADTENDD